MPVDASLISPLGLTGEMLNAYKMVPDYASMQLNRAKLEVDRQQAQALADKNRAAMEAAGKLNDAWTAYKANPNGKTLADVYAADPEHHAGYTAAAGQYARTTPEFQQASKLYYQAKKDPVSGAAALRAYLDARTAANGGQPLEEDQDEEEIYQDLVSPDANRQTLAQARMLKATAELSGDPAGFMVEHDKLFPKAEEHWDNGLLYVYEPGKQPRLVAQGPPGSRVLTNADGSMSTAPLIEGVPVMTPQGVTAPAVAPPTETPTDDGGQPPDPLAPAPEQPLPRIGTPRQRRTGGLTPRRRDGGDNPDAAVDNKLGIMSRLTGIGADTPLTIGQIPAVVDAMARTEGGKRNLSGRHRNPINIKDGPWARAQPGYIGSAKGFARFDSDVNGRRAAISLARNKFDAGHRTIRDMIEGRPSGQGAATQPRHAVAATQPRRKVVNNKTYVKMNDGKWYEAP